MDSQKHVADMLRTKLQKMNERELHNYRKLAVSSPNLLSLPSFLPFFFFWPAMAHNCEKLFTKLEPIFDQLVEKFEFSDPKEILSRLNTLESLQVFFEELHFCC
jgi:hypothetical protein